VGYPAVGKEATQQRVDDQDQAHDDEDDDLRQIPITDEAVVKREVVVRNRDPDPDTHEQAREKGEDARLPGRNLEVQLTFSMLRSATGMVVGGGVASR
jgi:hypothetical protein